MAKETSSLRGDNDPLEEAVARLNVEVQEIREKVDRFDAIAFAEEVRSELLVWKEFTEHKIQELTNNLQNTIVKLGNLSEVVKKAEILLKKLDEFDLDALDPEKLRQQVIDALASWRQQLEASVGRTDEKIAGLLDRLAALEEEVGKNTPELVRDLVLAALTGWKQSVEQLISENKAKTEALETNLSNLKTQLESTVLNIRLRLDGHDTAIVGIQQDFKKLDEIVKDLLERDIDPEKIKALLENLISVWKQSIETRLHDLEASKTEVATALQAIRQQAQQQGTDIDNLETALGDLARKVQVLADKGLDPEKIKSIVDDLIDAWKQAVEGRLDALDDSRSQIETALQAIRGHAGEQDTQIGNLDSALSELSRQVRELMEKGIDPEKVKVVVENLIGAWKTAVEGRLDALEASKTRIESALSAATEHLEKHNADLAKLDRELDSLAQKVQEIIEKGIDPDKVKTVVENLIGQWKQTVEERLALVDGLRNRMDVLQQRIENLPDMPAPGEIVRLVLIELTAWKQTLENKNTEQDAIIIAGRTDLETLKNRVLSIEEKINRLPSDGLAEAAIVLLINRELTTFKTSLDSKFGELQTLFNGLNAGITGLQTRLTAVETKLGSLPPGADPQQITTLVIAALAGWKNDLTAKITAIQVSLQTDRHDIESIQTALNALTVKVNAIVILTTEDIHQQVAADMAPLLQKIQSFETLLTALNGRVGSNETGISALQSGLAALQQILNGPFPANWETRTHQIIDGLLVAIIADLQLLNADKTTLLTALQNLTGDFELLTAQVTALETQVKELPDSVSKTELEALLLAAKTALEAFIHIQITEVKTAIEIRLQVLVTRIETLENINISINATLLQIRQEFVQHQTFISSLETLIITVQSTVDSLPAIPSAEEIVIQVTQVLQIWQQQVHVKIGELEQCCAEVQAKLAAFETDLSAKISKLENSDVSATGIRLARLCLQGWGVVGGLEIKSEEDFTVFVTQGIGVAPNGVLVIESSDRAFTHYRKFDNATAGEWSKAYDLWELLEWDSLGIDTNDSMPADIYPLTPQTGQALESPFILDKIVLLLPLGDQHRFLLIGRDDLMELSGKTAHLKKLMGWHDDTDFIFSEDYSPGDTEPSDDDLYKAFNPTFLLSEIPLFRFGFRPPDECDPTELDDTNFPEICSVENMYDTWCPIVQEAFTLTDKAITKVMEQYHPLLFPQLDKSVFVEKLDLLFEKWTAFKKYNEKASKAKSTKHYIQYFYDWARDLIAGYHELRVELQTLMSDLRSFTPELLANQRPYLMLGPAFRPDQDGLAAPLRDEFHQPPIYNGNAARLETCRLYYRRQFEMIEGFYLPGYAGAPAVPSWCKGIDDEPWSADFSRLRITPGKMYIHPLSRQSIPYYYPLVPGMESLQFYWDYRRAKTRTPDRHLSYHASDSPDSYSHWPEVVRPLYYSLDPHDFYRIEGHLGQSKVAIHGNMRVPVVDGIRFLIQKHNLDFDVREIEISCLQGGQATDLHQLYDLLDTENGIAYDYHTLSFNQDILGAEHLAGVPKGGTFIVVTTMTEDRTEKFAIADFSLPYRCCDMSNDFKSIKIEIDRIDQAQKAIKELAEASKLTIEKDHGPRITGSEKEIGQAKKDLATQISAYNSFVNLQFTPFKNDMVGHVSNITDAHNIDGLQLGLSQTEVTAIMDEKIATHNAVLSAHNIDTKIAGHNAAANAHANMIKAHNEDASAHKLTDETGGVKAIWDEIRKQASELELSEALKTAIAAHNADPNAHKK